MKHSSYVWRILVLALSFVVFSQFIPRMHGQAETGNRTPIIVTRLQLTHQTGAINDMPLFTPTADGLYRVSAYAEMTTLGTDGEICGYLNWVDGAGTQRADLIKNLNGTGPCLFVYQPSSATADTVISGKAGHPVAFEMGVFPPLSGSPEYSLLITVEQL